jgi:hypothetical protein
MLTVHTSRVARLWLLIGFAALGGCGGSSESSETKGGPGDASADAPVEAGTDADANATPDEGAEAASDGAAEGGTDGATDAGADTGPEGGPGDDASTDASPDSPDSSVGPAGAHAYVANFNNAMNGNLQVFDAPLSATSSAVLTLRQDNGLSAPEAIVLDPGGALLWVVDYNLLKVVAFALPLTATSVPVASVKTAQTPSDMAFDAAGNMWVAEFNDTIEMWTGPSPQGMPARTLKTAPPPANDNLFAIAIDSAGVLYAGGVSGPPAYGTQLFAFNSPTTESAPDFDNTNFFQRVSGLLVLGDRLYADTYFGGMVGYFTLPLNAGKAATMVTTGIAGEKLSLSPAGHLVVPGFMRDAVAFLAPPSFTTVDFTLSGGLNDPRSVTFGP